MTNFDTLIRDAFSGKPEARKALYFRTHLVPELEEALSEVFEAKPLIVLEPAQTEYDETDTFGILKWSIVERTVVKAVVEAAEQMSPVITTTDKLAATRELREALEAMVGWLDLQINMLEAP